MPNDHPSIDSVAYYNENDPKAAAWLRELIKVGAIAPGDVDERSIEDVTPNDLRGYRQHHFFAGIGGWSYALRLAGWPDDHAVWTGSCPCQPFSQAGKGTGTDDERHLWPAFHWLISECKPAIVFGEQVASPAGLMWLDLVQADLEGSGYAVGAADLCAAGVGAPHIRQRLYWVANAGGYKRGSRRASQANGDWPQQPTGCCDASELGDTSGSRGWRDTGTLPRAEGSAEGQVRSESDQPESASELGIAPGGGCARLWNQPAHSESVQASAYVDCRDGKRRPVEPGTFPLAHGVPGRVGLLRGYGNAIVPQVAAEFIRAYREAA